MNGRARLGPIEEDGKREPLGQNGQDEPDTKMAKMSQCCRKAGGKKIETSYCYSYLVQKSN